MGFAQPDGFPIFKGVHPRQMASQSSPGLCPRQTAPPISMGVPPSRWHPRKAAKDNKGPFNVPLLSFTALPMLQFSPVFGQKPKYRHSFICAWKSTQIQKKYTVFAYWVLCSIPIRVSIDTLIVVPSGISIG